MTPDERLELQMAKLRDELVVLSAMESRSADRIKEHQQWLGDLQLATGSIIQAQRKMQTTMELMLTGMQSFNLRLEALGTSFDSRLEALAASQEKFVEQMREREAQTRDHLNILTAILDDQIRGGKKRPGNGQE